MNEALKTKGNDLLIAVTNSNLLEQSFEEITEQQPDKNGAIQGLIRIVPKTHHANVEARRAMTRRQKNRCHREQDEISAARNLKKMWGDHKNWLPPEHFGSWEGVPGYMYVDMRRLSNKAKKAKIPLPDLWKEGGFLRRHYEAEGRRFNRSVLRKAEFDIDRLGTAPRGDTRWIDLTKEQLQACIEQLERKSQLREDAINTVMLGVSSQLPADKARSIGFTPPLWFQIDSATIPNGLPPLGKDCKLLLVPLHHRSIPHWTIVTINLVSGIVVHYDSRLDVNRHGRVINALGPFLRQHLTSVDPVFERAPCPQQSNTTDGGLYVLAQFRSLATCQRPCTDIVPSTAREEFVDILRARLAQLEGHLQQGGTIVADSIDTESDARGEGQVMDDEMDTISDDEIVESIEILERGRGAGSEDYTSVFEDSVVAPLHSEQSPEAEGVFLSPEMTDNGSCWEAGIAESSQRGGRETPTEQISAGSNILRSLSSASCASPAPSHGIATSGSSSYLVSASLGGIDIEMSGTFCGNDQQASRVREVAVANPGIHGTMDTMKIAGLLPEQDGGRKSTSRTQLPKEALQACIEQLESESQLRDDTINTVMDAIWSQLPASKARSIHFVDPLWFEVDSGSIPKSLPALQEGCTTLLVPLHHRDPDHWTLASVSLVSGVVSHYDSAPQFARFAKVVEALKRFLRPHFPMPEPIFNSVFVPRQPDQFSCGLYILAHFRSLAMDHRPCTEIVPSTARKDFVDILRARLAQLEGPLEQRGVPARPASDGINTESDAAGAWQMMDGGTVMIGEHRIVEGVEALEQGRGTGKEDYTSIVEDSIVVPRSLEQSFQTAQGPHVVETGSHSVPSQDDGKITSQEQLAGHRQFEEQTPGLERRFADELRRLDEEMRKCKERCKGIEERHNHSISEAREMASTFDGISAQTNLEKKMAASWVASVPGSIYRRTAALLESEDRYMQRLLEARTALAHLTRPFPPSSLLPSQARALTPNLNHLLSAQLRRQNQEMQYCEEERGRLEYRRNLLASKHRALVNKYGNGPCRQLAEEHVVAIFHECDAALVEIDRKASELREQRAKISDHIEGLGVRILGP